MRPLFKTLAIALVGYGSYTAAWACKCDPDAAPAADEVEVVGVLGAGTPIGGGCARAPSSFEHGLEVVEIRQDPDQTLEAGDTLDVELDQATSCKVGYLEGDTIRAYGTPDASGVLAIELCNSELR